MDELGLYFRGISVATLQIATPIYPLIIIPCWCTTLLSNALLREKTQTISPAKFGVGTPIVYLGTNSLILSPPQPPSTGPFHQGRVNSSLLWKWFQISLLLCIGSPLTCAINFSSASLRERGRRKGQGGWSREDPSGTIAAVSPLHPPTPLFPSMSSFALSLFCSKPASSIFPYHLTFLGQW